MLHINLIIPLYAIFIWDEYLFSQLCSHFYIFQIYNYMLYLVGMLYRFLACLVACFSHSNVLNFPLDSYINTLFSEFFFQKITELAHSQGAIVMVDNSIMSPVLSLPLELGAGMWLNKILCSLLFICSTLVVNSLISTLAKKKKKKKNRTVHFPVLF